MNQSSGNDLFTTTWSPDGRVFQVEYAQKHVDGGSLSLALCCSDGILLANEIKIVHDTVRKNSPTFNVIHAIDENVFISFCGSRPDGLCLVERARTEACNWKFQYGSTISAEILTNRLALYVNQFTEYLYLRPFGASFFIGSFDSKNGCQLYSLNPAGEVAGWNAGAHGKSKQQAKTELEKLDFSTVTVEAGLRHLAKIILKENQEDANTKKIKIQISYISNDSPKMTTVPPEVMEQLKAEIDQQLEDEDDDDDEDEDEDEADDE